MKFKITEIKNTTNTFDTNEKKNLWIRDFSNGPVLHTFSVGGLGLIPGQGSRSHMPQRVHMLQPKILHAAMKIEDPKYWN